MSKTYWYKAQRACGAGIDTPAGPVLTKSICPLHTSVSASLTSAIVSSVLNSPPKLLPPPKLPGKLASLCPCRDPVRLRDPWEELRFISSSWTDFAVGSVPRVFCGGGTKEVTSFGFSRNAAVIVPGCTRGEEERR